MKKIKQEKNKNSEKEENKAKKLFFLVNYKRLTPKQLNDYV